MRTVAIIQARFWLAPKKFTHSMSALIWLPLNLFFVWAHPPTDPSA